MAVMQFFRPLEVTLRTENDFAWIKPKVMDIQFCVNASFHFDFRGMPVYSYLLVCHVIRFQYVSCNLVQHC